MIGIRLYTWARSFIWHPFFSYQLKNIWQRTYHRKREGRHWRRQKQKEIILIRETFPLILKMKAATRSIKMWKLPLVAQRITVMKSRRKRKMTYRGRKQRQKGKMIPPKDENRLMTKDKFLQFIFSDHRKKRWTTLHVSCFFNLKALL